MRWDQRRGSFAELDTARALAPMIRAAQVEIEQRRELPQSLVTALTGQGLFRLLLPASFGGSQLCLPRFICCVEVIAEADGSTGWCVGQGGVFPNLADALPAATADEIWGRDPNAVVATGAPTGTRAQRIDGGYRLSGRWRFASG